MDEDFKQLTQEEYEKQQKERWPDFHFREVCCKQTGRFGVTAELMDALQSLRDIWGRPLNITSAYRHPDHSIEKRKKTPGKHSKGLAVDVAADSQLAFIIATNAAQCGFHRMGFKQKGNHRFVHLDVYPGNGKQLWSY